MKILKNFIGLAAIALCLGFTACSSDDDNDEKEFVRNEKIEGTWNLQDNADFEIERAFDAARL